MVFTLFQFFLVWIALIQVFFMELKELFTWMIIALVYLILTLQFVVLASSIFYSFRPKLQH